jgi:Anti-sigma-K factor rskA/Putative zinc-finger
MAEELHDLVAPYALDALEPGERELFESHLEECASCRAQLAEFQLTASALAYAESTEPPAALRERILEAARAENGAKVLQFPKRRWVFPATAVAAAAAAVVAIGVGLWAASLSRDLDRERSAKAGYARAIELLESDAQVVRLSNAEGGLLVTSEGDAALVVCGLEPAPSDRTYEAWVIQGETPRPAGLFRGGSGCPPVLLDRKVPPGSQVAVTLEQRGGATRPTGPLLVRSEGV